MRAIATDTCRIVSGSPSRWQVLAAAASAHSEKLLTIAGFFLFGIVDFFIYFS